MDALRSILVYAGSAAGALWLCHRGVRRISAGAALALALFPLLTTGRAIVSGGFYGPLNLAYSAAPLQARAGELLGADPHAFHDDILSDLVAQILPWQKAVREAVRHGRVPLWNRFLLSGDILLAAAQPAPLHPNTLIGFLLPLCAAWTFGRAFTFLLAALFCFLYLREIGLEERTSLFGAAAWGLSYFMLFEVGWPLSSAFAPFPLLLLGLRRLARGEPGGFGATLAALLLAIVAGHPETILHLVCSAGVFFLADLFRSPRRGGALAGAAAAGVLSLGLTAPVLLPFLEAAPQTMETAVRRSFFRFEKKSHTPREALRGAAGVLFPASYGRALDLPPALPPGFGDASHAYLGGAAMALAAAGLLSRRKAKWALALVAALTLGVAVGVPGITDAVSRLPLFDIAVNGRLTGITAFCLAALSALGLERVLEGRGRSSGIFLTGSGLLFLLLGFGRRAMSSRGAIALPEFDRGLAMLAAPVFLLGMASLLLASRPGALALAAFAVALIFHMAEAPRLYPTFSSRDFYPAIAELERLPASPEPYRTAGLGHELIPNQAALYGLEDPRGYEAMTNSRYFETYPIWCVHQPISFNRIDDPTRPFLSFLNVRYAVAAPGASAPPGWRELVRGPDCAIFENPKALARAFAPARIRFVAGGGPTVAEMKECPDFSAVGWIEDRSRPAGEIANGAARVAVKAQGPDLRLAIDAAAPAWIVVSETNWKGWRAREGARELPIFYANHAFVGFHVEAGRHEVLLRYWPRSFSLGVAISLISLAVVGGIGLRGRRRLAGPGGEERSRRNHPERD